MGSEVLWGHFGGYSGHFASTLVSLWENTGVTLNYNGVTGGIWTPWTYSMETFRVPGDIFWGTLKSPMVPFRDTHW